MSYFQFVQALHQGLSWSHAVHLVARKMNYKKDVLVLSFDTTCDGAKCVYCETEANFPPFHETVENTETHSRLLSLSATSY